MSRAAATFPMLPPVDRRLFIPDVVWVAENKVWVQLSRHDDPLEWERLVASDQWIATDIKHGIWPVSSSSSPGAMARMISALRIRPGMRVLEIGTGTGWNAACLAALGAKVVSVEIDASFAEQARINLRKAGYGDVVVIAGNGEYGAAEYAPYDRVLSTAAANKVPYAWVEQCSEGGLIVTPYVGEGHRWALLVLTASGRKAVGGMEGEVSFMPLRGHGLPQVELQAIECHDDLYIEVSKSRQTVHYSRENEG